MLAYSEVLKREAEAQTIKRNRTRYRLLAASAELLNTYPPRDLMVSEISKHAGSAKGTFYIYFESKEQMLYELCDGYTSFENSILPELDINMKPYKLVRVIVAWYEESFRKNAGVLRAILQMADVDERFQGVWQRRNRRIADHVVNFLSEYLGVNNRASKSLRQLCNAIGNGMDQTLFNQYRVEHAWQEGNPDGSFVEMYSFIAYRTIFGQEAGFPKSSRFYRVTNRQGEMK